MGIWSATNATRAYLHTLDLCKNFKSQRFSVNSSNTLVEPQCIEYISALAAGNQAKLMVNVTSEEGLSPSTLALAIAAKYTHGHLICVCNDQNAANQMKSQLEGFGLGYVASFKVGELCEVIKEFKNIEFAVVDSRIVDCEEVLFDMDMNPEGSVVILSNLFHQKNKKEKASSSYAKLKQGMSRRPDGMFESGVLPIGNGMEVTKIGKGCTKQTKKSSKRTFLVYEETRC